LSTEILSTNRLRKAFGGVVAVNDVTLSIEQGLITAIIGPNGAGKSTLFNLIAGVYPATSGEVRFESRVLNGLPGHARVGLGLARTFQGVELFGNMTVLENVMMGRYTRSSAGFLAAALRLPQHRRDEREIKEAALRSLETVGLANKAEVPALSVPFGQQRLLAVARALATDPKLLMLDEPGAGLNPSEKAELAGLIRRLRDRGITILLVEHDMDLVMGLSDHVIVLDYGEKIAEGTTAEIQNDERVIAAYLGSDDELIDLSTANLATSTGATTEGV
jgi:branched-chain amino acid transport system ATP-binding protein